MKSLFILWALSACVYGYVPYKSVKGGPTRYTEEEGYNKSGPYTNITNTGRHNEVEEIGVCYVEVLTAHLVHDKNYVPAGNGSRPDLSRIRTCCQGYSRNSNNPMICDPVCSHGCVNSVCVAPDTCQCYPNYEKNLDGICIPTCPYSCPNGHCSGHECICDFGYKWNPERKYCVPKCKDNCAGLGFCTAPNTCFCPYGYQSTAEGSCEPTCKHCQNGICEGNICKCHRGYSKDSQGNCKPQCYRSCPHNAECIAPNVCSERTTTISINQVDSSQEQKHQYPGGRPNFYDPYGSKSQDSSNQRPYEYDEYYQETHNRQQHEICAWERDPNLTQHQTFDNHNQKPQDSSQHSYDLSQRGQYIDRTTQRTSSSSQYDDKYQRNQNANQGNNSHQNTFDSTQQRSYDSTRRDTEGINHGNYDSYHGTGTNQRPHSNYNSTTYSKETPEVNNQMYVNPHYTDQNIDILQQTNVPVCSMPCLNGYCVEGNQCRCKPGYIPDKTNPNVCQPHCPGGCPNGVCSGPGLCLCNLGYYKDKSVKGRQVCVKRT